MSEGKKDTTIDEITEEMTSMQLIASDVPKDANTERSNASTPAR